MEPHVGDIVRMGEIAAMMFDKDEGLFIFATTHLDEILQQFRARYYAMDFPEWSAGADRPKSATGSDWPLTHGDGSGNDHKGARAQVRAYAMVRMKEAANRGGLTFTT
jgi:hypothetical protein